MSKPIWFWCHVDRVVLEIVESLWAVGTDGRSGGLPGGAEGFEPLTSAVQAPARLTGSCLPRRFVGLISQAQK
jgi:hypothetical protein